MPTIPTTLNALLRTWRKKRRTILWPQPLHGAEVKFSSVLNCWRAVCSLPTKFWHDFLGHFSYETRPKCRTIHLKPRSQGPNSTKNPPKNPPTCGETCCSCRTATATAWRSWDSGFKLGSENMKQLPPKFNGRITWKRHPLEVGRGEGYQKGIRDYLRCTNFCCAWTTGPTFPLHSLLKNQSDQKGTDIATWRAPDFEWNPWGPCAQVPLL